MSADSVVIAQLYALDLTAHFVKIARDGLVIIVANVLFVHLIYDVKIVEFVLTVVDLFVEDVIIAVIVVLFVHHVKTLVAIAVKYVCPVNSVKIALV